MSVLKITIWVVVGQLSAHELLTDAYENTDSDPLLWYQTHDNALIRLAVDLADQLMSVLYSPTGISYSAVHLYYFISGRRGLA